METDGGATKPATPRLAAVEAAEQALELRVWGWVGITSTGEEEVAGREA
jgi:hypothetical protein